MSDSVRPHRWQPTRLLCPWDSPGKSTGVGCHCLLQAWKWKVKIKSLSRAWLLVTPQTAAHQAPPSMGFSRQEYWSGVPLPSPCQELEDAFSMWFTHMVESSAGLTTSEDSWASSHGCLGYSTAWQLGSRREKAEAVSLVKVRSCTGMTSLCPDSREWRNTAHFSG